MEYETLHHAIIPTVGNYRTSAICLLIFFICTVTQARVEHMRYSHGVLQCTALTPCIQYWPPANLNLMGLERHQFVSGWTQGAINHISYSVRFRRGSRDHRLCDGLPLGINGVTRDNLKFAFMAEETLQSNSQSYVRYGDSSLYKVDFGVADQGNEVVVLNTNEWSLGSQQFLKFTCKRLSV